MWDEWLKMGAWALKAATFKKSATTKLSPSLMPEIYLDLRFSSLLEDLEKHSSSLGDSASALRPGSLKAGWVEWRWGSQIPRDAPDSCLILSMSGWKDFLHGTGSMHSRLGSSPNPCDNDWRGSERHRQLWKETFSPFAVQGSKFLSAVYQQKQKTKTTKLC